MRRRTLAAIGTIAAIATCAVPVAPAVAGADRSASTAAHVAIGTKLANPRQLTFSPSGALVVALAGSGGLHAQPAGKCFDNQEIGQSCIGATAGVARIAHPATAAAGSSNLVATGIMSIAAAPHSGQPVGSSATGLDAISFAPDGTEYGIVTWTPHKLLRGQSAAVRDEDGALVRITPTGAVHVVARIGDFSMNHPNAHHTPQYSDPYGVLALAHEVFVTDAANNTLLRVQGGHVTTVHVFPYRNGHGGDGSFDTVPTSIAYDGHHLFVGTLGSLIPGDGKVYELTKTGRVVRAIDGLSQVTGIAVSSTGSIFVTEIFGGMGGPFDKAGRPNGALVKVAPNGHMVSRHVPLPGGVAVRHGHVYVSVNTISPAQGAVWRLSAGEL